MDYKEEGIMINKDETQETTTAEEVKVVGLTVKYLKSIDENVRSIKSMLTFFVVLAVIGLIVSFCSAWLNC